MIFISRDNEILNIYHVMGIWGVLGSLNLGNEDETEEKSSG